MSKYDAFLTLAVLSVVPPNYIITCPFAVNFFRRQRMARDRTRFAQRDFLAPVPDSLLLNLSNVPNESGSKVRQTLFGPLLEQPRSTGSAQNKKPLPVEKKIIPTDVVQTWVERSKDVSAFHAQPFRQISPSHSSHDNASFSFRSHLRLRNLSLAVLASAS